jgi:hypothetical protein
LFNAVVYNPAVNYVPAVAGFHAIAAVRDVSFVSAAANPTFANVLQ